MRKIINYIFVVLGFIFLGIGVLGAIIPILPATPFFMLAAFFFAKGSKRFHCWFIGTAFYLKYVEPAVNKKEMDKSSKRKALATLFLIFTVSFILIPIWHAKAVIVVVAIFHFYYFTFKIKTVSEKKMKAVQDES